MKKSLFTILIAMVGWHAAKAQDFYVKAGAGYGFAVAGQMQDGAGFAYSGSFNQGIDSTTIEEDFDLKKVSFLSGVQARLGIGCMLNKNIGIEVDALLGVATRSFSYNFQREDQFGYLRQSIETRANFPAILSPSVLMQVPGKTLTCYARGGIAIPVANKLTQTVVTENYLDTTNPRNSAGTVEIRTRLGLGFSGAMGLKYNIGKNTQLWAEASLLSISLYAQEQTIVEYTVNGSNALPYLTPGQKHQTFEMKNSTGNANASSVFPTFAIPYSNIGICVGVSTRL